MKKYFIAETDEEIVFGDTLELDLTKKTKHGLHKVKGEIEFSKHSVPLLLEIGAIEEHEVEEEEVNTPEEDLIDFGGTGCEALDDLIEDFETLEERVDKLEERQDEFIKIINNLIECWKETLQEADKVQHKKK